MRISLQKNTAYAVMTALMIFLLPSSVLATGSILISSCVQLQQIGSGGGFPLDGDYVLTQNIDCGATASWNDGKGFDPIGNNDSAFTGTFDGNSYTISNLYIDRVDDLDGESEVDEHNVGLFGYVSGAHIHDLGITSSRVRGYQNVGGVVGYAQDSLLAGLDYNNATSPNACDPSEHCVWARFGAYGGGILGYGINTVLSDVSSGGSVKGSGNIIGGIVGYLEAAEGVASIDHVSSTADIDGGTSIGGVAGQLVGVALSYATASGYIDVTNDIDKVGNGGGGLVGTMSGGSISYSQASGDVYGNNEIGGLVGTLDGSSVDNSSATGMVTGQSQVGGFAGTITASLVTDSSASGLVTADSNAGGFVGSSACGSHFLRSSASGAVYNFGSYTGGFSGYDQCMGAASVFEEVTASGAVHSQLGDTAGGLVGAGIATTILKSSASGIVDAGNSNEAGGLVGRLQSMGDGVESSVRQSFATGEVIGLTRVGGLIGLIVDNAVVEDSYARGMISGVDQVGGLIGGQGGSGAEVRNSYAANSFGEVTGVAGGLLGSAGDSFSVAASFWDQEVSGITTSAGMEEVAKTSAQLKNLATFTTNLGGSAWNFSTIWGRFDAVNGGYPCLRWSTICADPAPSPSPSPSPSISPSPSPVLSPSPGLIDSDGIDAATESAAPNNGDANGDGTADGEQSSVTSFVNPVTGRYAVLQSSCAIQGGIGIQAESTSARDGGYDYPVGLMSFSLACGAPGTTAQVSQYFYGDYDAASFAARKFFAATAAYTAIPGALFTSVRIGTQNALKLSYVITDGGPLDQDGVANGVIVDPAGPAQQVVSVPKTGLGRLAGR